jgi:hypothetical protein
MSAAVDAAVTDVADPIDPIDSTTSADRDDLPGWTEMTSSAGSRRPPRLDRDDLLGWIEATFSAGSRRPFLLDCIARVTSHVECRACHNAALERDRASGPAGTRIA